MPTLEDLTVVLLAGGKARRMGMDKAVLRWRGKPLVQVLAERFKAAGLSVLVAGGARDWAQRLKDLPFTVVPDLPAHENFGPLAGIEAGLLHTKAKLVGVVACDLPFAEPKLLLWLAERVSGADAVVPMVGDEPQPLHAVYSRSCLPQLVAQLEGEDKSVKSFLKSVRVVYVPEGEWAQTFDPKCLTVHLNEPKDLEGLEEFAGGVKSLVKVPVLAFVGFSGSGKTKLIEGLTKVLTADGYKVGVIKHHGHADEEGKDTWRFRRAGAEAVALVAPDGMAVLLPKGDAEFALEALLKQASLDLVLVEGFKTSPFPKLLVLRPHSEEREAQRELEELLSQIPDKSGIVGVVTSVKLPVGLPQFAHDDIDAVRRFLQQNFLTPTSTPP